MLVTQQPVLRRFWYAVMPMTKLEAGPQPFTLLGEDIVLWKKADGTPAAVRDRCCHRTAKLSKGFVEGDNLVCGHPGGRQGAGLPLLRALRLRLGRARRPAHAAAGCRGGKARRPPHPPVRRD